MPKDLYFRIRTFQALNKAWKQVYNSGVKSQSLETQNAVKEFRSYSDRQLKKIQRQLQQNKFKFNPARGVPIYRNGKTDRPLVVADIKDRVVQRSLLDVIQSQKSISKYVNTPNSFGGLKNKKVEDAIRKVCQASKDGLKHYITSDIKNFFTRIPRLEVINTILALLPDRSIETILHKASETELKNLSILGHKVKLFPTYELGVAQGCCLSPLFGNVLLHDFDKELNLEPDKCRCYRYIDDFIIVSYSSEDATKAFNKAKKILNKFDMYTYQPADGSGKSKQGKISNTLEYLGCSINDDFVHPSKEKRNDLKKKIKDLLKKRSLQLRTINTVSWSDNYSAIKTMQDISNILIGWGNQYSFCNSTNLFKTIDSEIDKYVYDYAKNYKYLRMKLKHNNDHEAIRKLLGIHLLSESKKNAILPLTD